MHKRMKRGQTFSTDALIAVVLFFMAAIMLFYLSEPAADSRQAGKLQRDSESLILALSSEQNTSAVFIKGAKIDTGKLDATVNLSYESLKNQLGVDSDFCVYFEDEQGNIVPIKGKMGVGSPLANFSGRSCNESISG